MFYMLFICLLNAGAVTLILLYCMWNIVRCCCVLAVLVCFS